MGRAPRGSAFVPGRFPGGLKTRQYKRRKNSPRLTPRKEFPPFRRRRADHEADVAALDRSSALSGSRTVSTGKFSAIHPVNPSCNGWTRVIPLRLSWSATRALVASLGQEQ